MGKKNKAGQRVASNVSGATSLSSSAAPKRINKTSVIYSAFSPTSFQLSLFASVVETLSAHQLRIHDTTTARLSCTHDTHKSRITCIDWGYYDAHGAADQPARKKRKKSDSWEKSPPGAEDAVVAYGTDRPTIHLFSPAGAKVVAELANGHTDSVRDFKFQDFGLGSEAWSLGSDGKLVQWNLSDGSISRSIESSVSLPCSLLPLSSSVLVASNATYIVDLEENSSPRKLGDGANSVHTLYANSPTRGTPTAYLCAPEHENSVFVYDLASGSPIGTMVAGSEVESIGVYQEPHESSKKFEGILAAITRDGEIKIFENPFRFKAQAKSNDPADIKAHRKQSRRTVSASVAVTRPDEATVLPLVNVQIQDTDLVIACHENAEDLAFERIEWRKESGSGLELAGSRNVIRVKTAIGINSTTMNGAKDMGRAQVDESKAVVSQGQREDAMDLDVISISSGHGSESDSEDEFLSPMQGPNVPNGVNHIEEKEEDAEEDDDGEPSFGDILKANNPDTIDVAASTQTEQQQGLMVRPAGTTTTPGLSLGTVLAQSLRTNDSSMLESCFHESDLNVIRATVEKLDSTMATKLLKKLAEKMHSRPGRAGSLMVWIQWTLVAHGGYLGSQPHIVKDLASLHRVVKERANSLQPLLELKGKLDMLEAQMNLRRSMQQKLASGPGADEEVDDSVIYVEGEEQSSDEEDDKQVAYEVDDEDDEDEMSVEQELDDSDDNVIDDEASEEDDSESESGEEVDYEQDDDTDDESEDEAGLEANPKPRLTNGTGKKHR